MKLWRWQKGRQQYCEYKKFPLWYFKIWRFGFDAYILKYEADTILAEHTDPVVGGKHWRLNIKLWGESKFKITGKPITKSWFIFFRPDIQWHSLYNSTKTTKLSFGFVKFDK